MEAMSHSADLPTLSLSDPTGTHTFPLKRDSTSIGRATDQDFVLQEPYVSRRHAVIALENGEYTVQDQGSTHGTYVNGIRVEHAALKADDALQFGSLQAPRLRFRPPCPPELEANTQRSLSGDLLSALTVFRQPEGESKSGGEMAQLNFLLTAARRLNAGGAISDIFRALLQLSIELAGVERGFVFLSKDGALHLALGLQADGTEIEEDSTVSRRAIKKSIDSESTFSVSDTLADDSAAAWASVVANEIRSVYCIPLRRRVSATEPNRLLGLLYLDSRLVAGHMTEIDHQVLDALAMEASTLVHNALLAEAEYKSRLAAEELTIAARIHTGLMSMEMPVIPFAALRARTVPCHAIGGDFYDAVALDDCVCVAIADISGKGLPAAIVAATLQGIIHSQFLTGLRLDKIAELVNTFLCSRRVDKYATMVLMRLFPDGQVEYINCGHVLPIVVRGSESCQMEEANLVVGLLPDATYTSARCQLAPGERVLLTTDGITEAENMDGVAFGDEGFRSVVHLPTPEEILDCVARYQTPNEAQDDWTLVDVQYLGA
ncbi:MAG TPA: SpoIIE family protein phosphatase [Terracidiphilus sp.]|nr:SpoIIE family protein phosphatase [Terracidiphilus sp.]